MRLFVLPVLAPALLEGLRLNVLGKTGDQVGMAGGDALLSEGLGHCGDELQAVSYTHLLETVPQNGSAHTGTVCFFPFALITHLQETTQ